MNDFNFEGLLITIIALAVTVVGRAGYRQYKFIQRKREWRAHIHKTYPWEWWSKQ